MASLARKQAFSVIVAIIKIGLEAQINNTVEHDVDLGSAFEGVFLNGLGDGLRAVILVGRAARI